MLVPVWSVGLIGMIYLGYDGMDVFLPLVLTASILVFEILAVYRHMRVWRFKEMYFKIYQGLSVLIVDSDLRLDPEKLNAMFKDIEQAALEAICTDPSMKLMVGTLSRVSGLKVQKKVKPHKLDNKIKNIFGARALEISRNSKIHDENVQKRAKRSIIRW